jgi:hypothetical protein
MGEIVIMRQLNQNQISSFNKSFKKMTVIKIRNWSKKLINLLNSKKINLLNSKKKIHLKKKNKFNSALKTKEKNEIIYLAKLKDNI